jgi:hypothetical protein
VVWCAYDFIWLLSFVLVYPRLWPSTYKYLTVFTVVPQLCICLSLIQSPLPSPLYFCLVWAHALISEPLNHWPLYPQYTVLTLSILRPCKVLTLSLLHSHLLAHHQRNTWPSCSSTPPNCHVNTFFKDYRRHNRNGHRDGRCWGWHGVLLVWMWGWGLNSDDENEDDEPQQAMTVTGLTEWEQWPWPGAMEMDVTTAASVVLHILIRLWWR